MNIEKNHKIHAIAWIFHFSKRVSKSQMELARHRLAS